MTVAEIQSVVAMYLQRSVAKFDVTGTGANLILVAMNNARKYAERRHNWSVCRKKGYLSVTTANEVAWDSPTWFGGGTEKMKEGKHWWLRGDATDVTNKVSTTDCPIKILGHGVKHVVETKQNYEAWGEDYAELRQLRESSSWHPMLNQPHGVVRGKWLELYPKPTATQVLVVDGYHWWADWTASDVVASVWSGVLPDTIYGTYIDDSYVWVELDNTNVVHISVMALDNANDGFTVSQLALPYGTRNKPSMGLTQTEFTKEYVQSCLNLMGFTAELTATSVRVSIAGGDPTVNHFVKLYDHNIGDFVVNENITFTEDTAADLSATTDWWTENAAEYLILRTLVECNRLGHVFVGNKEGNLPSPEKQAEQLLQDLITQDNAGELAGGQIELY